MPPSYQSSLLSLLCSLLASLLLFYQGQVLASIASCSIALYFAAKFKPQDKVSPPDGFHVVIIGGGLSGICMAKKLVDQGVQFTILEKCPRLGGTWLGNRYPGVACDVPSHYYSFSFCLNPNWSKKVSPGQEILSYLEYVASRFGIYPRVKFNQAVKSAAWDEDTHLWSITMTSGDIISANVLVDGTGPLHVPKTPNFNGREDFAGQSFHTSQWPHGFNPTNKTVAVIGTGASGVQVVPNLASMGVKQLIVFQRTPCWSPPRFEYFYSEFYKKMFTVFPVIQYLYRSYLFWSAEHMHLTVLSRPNLLTKKVSSQVRQATLDWHKTAVKDPQLARKLTPTYTMGAKRITPSDEYLKTFNNPNVKLCDSKIECIAKDGIKTLDEDHKVDVIIYATGFDMIASNNAFDVTGLCGKHLAEEQGITPKAFLGITHHLAPNFFIMLGPGTGLGHGSLITMVECMTDYTMDCIRQMINNKAKSMVVKQEKVQKYFMWAQEKHKGMVFGDNKEVSGWYHNSEGVNWTLYPGSITSYWWSTRRCQVEDYCFQF